MWVGQCTPALHDMPNLEHNPLKINEKEFVVAQDNKGVMLSAALFGHRASSTRAELGAGIEAMLADSPTHQCTYSMAYVLKATQILKGARPKKSMGHTY